MRTGPVLSIVLPAVLGGFSAEAQDLRELKARGILRILAVPRPAFPYFVSTAPERPPGFDYEILAGFARVERLEVQVVEVEGWDAIVPALRGGKGDVIAGGFRDTTSRRQFVDFTIEVLPSRRVVITRKPHRVVGTLEELRAERVGTIRGTSLPELVAALGVPRSQVDDSIPPGGLPNALKTGQVTAVVDGVEDGLIAAQLDPHIQLGMFVGPPESLAYGLRKDSPDLRAALNTYLMNFRRTLSWNRLLVKYFGGTAPELLKKARAE